MPHFHDSIKQLQKTNGEIRKLIPEVFDGFARTNHAAYADGALSGSTKQLMALAVAMAEGCGGCIASHARGAARKGATPQEVAETIGVAIQMKGGPGTVYGPVAWEAYHEFKERYG